MIKTITATGIIVKFGNLALLGRRSKDCQSLNGYWSIPCGTIDPGETPLKRLKENSLKRQILNFLQK